MHPNIDLDSWIISDTHFGHGGIIRYAKRPANHNELMFANWEQAVGPTELLLHLGDIAMTRGADEPRLRALPGDKWMIPGNHDKLTVTQTLQRFGVKAFKPPFSGTERRLIVNVGGQRVAFSHRPLAKTDTDWDVNVHGHIHINGWPRAAFESGRRYVNVSVEYTSYAPNRLRDILDGNVGQKIADGWINMHDDK